MRGKGKPSGKNKPTGCMAFFVTVGRIINQRLATARNALRRKFRRNNNDVRPLTPDELDNETGTPDLVITLKPVGPVKAEKMRASSPRRSSLEVDFAIDIIAIARAEEEALAAVNIPTVDKTSTMDNASTRENAPIEDSIAQSDDHKEQVRIYVNQIIQNAVAIVKAEDAAKNQRDSESLTSSIIDEIAELAVSDSLSKIAASTMDNNNIRDTVACDNSGISIASSEISEIAELAVGDSLSKIAAITDGNNNNTRKQTYAHKMLGNSFKN